MLQQRMSLCNRRSGACSGACRAGSSRKKGSRAETQRTASTATASPATAQAQALAAARNLVVAIDGEEASYRAIGWTLDHLYRDGDILHLLHVVPEVATMSQLGGYNLAASLGPEEGMQAQLAAHAEAFVHSHCGPLAAQRGAAWQLDLVPGRCNTSVSDTIISKINELDAAMVVLSVRPTSFIEGLFSMGISKQVAARCTKPTLLFHEQ